MVTQPDGRRLVALLATVAPRLALLCARFRTALARRALAHRTVGGSLGAGLARFLGAARAMLALGTRRPLGAGLALGTGFPLGTRLTGLSLGPRFARFAGFARLALATRAIAAAAAAAPASTASAATSAIACLEGHGFHAGHLDARDRGADQLLDRLP